MISRLQGDLIILGVGGKMGPSLATMARKAASKAGKAIRIIGVDLFPDKGIQKELQKSDIDTVRCDLLKPGVVEALPDAANVIYMVGMKFGTVENQPLTWALNTFLPGLVARKYKDSRIVVFSTGNVYPFVPITSRGANEKTPVNPVGEYAQSCLARERMFTYHSEKFSTPICIIRLNYACELRYGVLVDIALKVWKEEPINLTMGYFNTIWQADANERALLLLDHCQSPPFIINITGPEKLAVRDVAARFGQIMKKLPVLEHTVSATALLNDAFNSILLFGKPRVSLEQMIEWIARWVMEGNRTFGKPTHYEVRDGKF
jgi:nucleoside-diphosphate-sugar epimerase